MAKVQATKSSSKMPVIIGAVIVVALLGGGGYFLSQNGQNPLSVVTGGKMLNPNCEYKDPELCKFLNNWKAMENYTMKSLSTNDGVTTESVIEMSGKETYHMVTSQDGKEMYNVIRIGDTTYNKDLTDGKWFKIVDKKDPNVTPVETTKREESNMKLDFDKKDADVKSQFKFVGKEACGSFTCFKYQEVQTGEINDQFTNYLYFDDKEYLLRKYEMVDANGNKDETSLSYDKVTISAPSPVKEGDASSYIPGMSAEEKQQYEDAKKEMQQYQQQMPQDLPSFQGNPDEMPSDESGY